METIGERILYARKSLGLTQQEFAEKLGLASYLCVYRYEKNLRTPWNVVLYRIADLYGYSYIWLKNGIGDRFEPKITTFVLLKVWPPFFDAILYGFKTFELRKDDRDFKVGQKLLLMEFDPIKKDFTGRELKRLIIYKLSAEEFDGIKNGYCILGLGIYAN